MRSMPALAFLALIVASAIAQDPLPQEKDKLIAYAQEQLQSGRYAESVRAYEAFVEKFPAAAEVEEALTSIASTYHSILSLKEDARRTYRRLCERFPKSESTWDWRFQIALTFHPKTELKQALEEFGEIARKSTEPDVRTDALRHYWELQGKELTLVTDRTYMTGEEPAVRVRRKEMKEVAYRAYRIDYAAFLPFVNEGEGRGFATMAEKIGRADRKLLKEWKETYPVSNGDETVPIPSTAGGVYVLEAEHDGFTMEAVAVVGRYGLITKAAAGKLLCFVQERATSRPVADAEIRVLSDERPFRGATDSRGLFVTEGFKGGRIVGLVDGEIFLTDAWSHEPAEPEVRIHVATDRPIYRPGHTVRFRIVSRDDRSGELSFRPGQRLIVKVADPRYNPIHQETVTLGDFGTAEGSFRLGDSPTLGEYSISARSEPKPGERQEDDFFWYGSTGRTEFRVDEYRKPEFKVIVDYAAPQALQGKKIEGKIHAEYYFGGPVEAATVQYAVFRARLSWWGWGWPYYYDWYSKEGFELHEPVFFSSTYLGDQVADGDGVTDRDGNLAFTIENTKEDHDAVYTVVAQVTDLSRREVRGQGSCRAPHAEFGLAMSLNKYVYKAGDRMTVKVRTIASDDKPVAETRIVLKAKERHWNKDGAESDTPLYEASTVTDAHGIAQFTYTPELAGGYLVLTAEAKDRHGNVATTEEWAWLAGPGDWYNPRDLTGFSLTLDKKTYEIGDTAQVLIQSSQKNVTLLFTVEGSEIHHRELVTLKGHAGTVDLKLSDPSWAPNVTLSATAIKGNEVLAAYKRLVLNPSHKFVNIEIKPDREEYRPRQKAVYEIRTTGADGCPVAAEVAVGIVDDSIYALQEEYEEDLRKFFVPPRWNEVETSASLFYYHSGGAKGGGGPLTGATFGLDEPREGGEPRFAETEVRSKFADTMLWKIVRTSADGLARVEVEIADNLTTWRATARAVTADSRFGVERHSVVSRKNVIVRVETPRFLTQNDASTLSAVIHNYLPVEKELRIEFSASGVETRGDAVATVRIPAGGQKRLDWKAIAKGVGAAKVTVKALGDTDSDAMEVTFPVLPHGSPRWETKAGGVAERTVEKVTLPADAIPGTAELLIAVSPVHASMVLDALDSLAGYPYGCVEQTMSRFLPSVIVAGSLKKLGLSRPKLEAELPRMISSGLQRLYSMQHHDGGWGWWQQDATNPWMTAYVLSGLRMARDAGVAVSPDALEQAVAAARRMLSLEEDPNLKAYLLHALGGPEDEVEFLWRDLLAQQTETLKPYAQALLALSLHRQGLDARPLLRALEGTALFAQGRDHGWLDDAVETAAAALRAFLAIDPKNPAVARLVEGLGRKRRGAWWTSTRQTAMAVYAITDYLERTDALNPDMTVSLTLNGKQVYSEKITRESWPKFDGVRNFAASELKPGENEIVIEKQGAGSPTYSVGLRYHSAGENLPASKGGFTIERAYHAIERREGERILRRLPEGFTAVSGQEVEVTLTFTADREYEWLMVEDPLPAGFEPVREYWGFWGWNWDYWYSTKEFHDERVSIGMRSIPPGVHTASYTMRAETPGDYHVLPARAFNMYFPEVGAHSAESRVRVGEIRRLAR
ncbi:MAG TPA: MG2 domain-containing protein [Planctomycetota bacterium]|nr:MG2 domain-containing protein [Planctomycetota bacterium]